MGMVLNIVIFVVVIVLILSVYDLYSNNDAALIEERIKNLKTGTIKTEREKIEQSSILDRITKIVQKDILSLFMEETSRGNVGKLQAKLLKAGVSGQTDEMEIRAQRFIFGTLFGIIVLALMKNPAFAIIGVGLGLYYPDIQLDSKIKKRQEDIRDSIPDFLDLLAATFPGSKGFEDAIERICKRSQGVIQSEFKVYVDEVNAGKRKKDALRALADRCNVKEIDMLVNQIIQSEALGTGLEDTLNSQAKKLRMLKKTQAEIKAKKASAFMLSSVLFSLTSILIVVAGPAILQIMEAMG